MNERNEAAERDEYTVRCPTCFADYDAANARDADRMLSGWDKRLAAERRATVERIRERLEAGPHWVVAILDEEAAR